MHILAIAWSLAIGLLFARAVRGQITPHYNITSVTSEQLNNAVRVKIDADGMISASPRRWWSGGEEANYYLIWELVAKQTSNIWSADCYPKVNKIKFRLRNACPQVGNVIWVGKYPVSHVRLMMRPGGEGRFGLDVEVVLHKPMRLRKFKFADFDMWDAYRMDHRDPACFEVVQSPDRRSLMVTVMSDRLPERREHRAPADVPEQERELVVNSRDGMLDIHARNMPLSDLVDRINQKAGAQMTVNESAASRLVVAELPGATPREFVEWISQCYGLGLSGSPDRLLLADPAEHTAAAQAAVVATRIPLRHIKASLAVNLLPNFLADYMNVDEQGNALVVSGSKALVDKVAADLEQVDRPPTLMRIQSVMVESSSSTALAKQIGLAYSDQDFRVSADGALGELVYSKVSFLPRDFEARLRALMETGRATVRGRSTLVVANGESGEIFVGVDKYILVRRTLYASTPVVEPVSAGVKLSVTPWAGSHAIRMNVTTEVRAIGEIDPLTSFPVVDTRSAKGAFTISPGEAVLIGGLAQAQTETVARKIPMLGDLPLIGGLFRQKRRVSSSSELTVFLTASIIESNSPHEAEVTLDHPDRGV